MLQEPSNFSTLTSAVKSVDSACAIICSVAMVLKIQFVISVQRVFKRYLLSWLTTSSSEGKERSLNIYLEQTQSTNVSTLISKKKSLNGLLSVESKCFLFAKFTNSADHTNYMLELFQKVTPTSGEYVHSYFGHFKRGRLDT